MAKGESCGTLIFLKMNNLSSFGDLVLIFYLLSLSFLSKPGKSHYEGKKKLWKLLRGVRVPKKPLLFHYPTAKESHGVVGSGRSGRVCACESSFVHRIRTLSSFCSTVSATSTGNKTADKQ